jgi:2-polyprenyl-3-methyl-5-hydroxy-6-metoxy-1,4-benzoquinol methylase
MINIAKEKAKENGVNIDFRVMDLRELRLNKKFDVCILMFAVIDYITNTKDLLKALPILEKPSKMTPCSFSISGTASRFNHSPNFKNENH